MNKHLFNFFICLGIITAGFINCKEKISAAEVSYEDLPSVNEEKSYLLPSSADLRKRGLTSEVKNQGEFGTCWAHAVLGMIESDLIADDPDTDLSEMYFYAMASEFYDKNSDGLTLGDASGLLANWIGPENEDAAPYGTEYNSDLSFKEHQQNAKYHLKNVHHFTKSKETQLYDTRAMKKAINDGHPLYFYCSCFDAGKFMNSQTNAYFSNNTATGTEPHALLIVGYDDNFPASSFLSDPETDGAWLVKNSWGPGFGDNGYFWLSYSEDINEPAFFDVEYAENHDILFENDDFGSGGIVTADTEGEEIIYAANIYTAGENCFISDIMINCVSPGDLCEIQISTDLTDDSDPLSGNISSASSAVLDGIGWRTVRLDTPVFAEAGRKFSVIVKFKGEKGAHIACELSEPQRQLKKYDDFYNVMKDDYSKRQIYSRITPKMISRTFESSQSFVSTDGETWTDMYDIDRSQPSVSAGNISLKALALKEDKVLFSDYSDFIKKDSYISLSTPDSRKIFYSVNNGEFQLYDKPILISENTCISAYSEGSSNIYSHNYEIKKAALSSLLINTDEQNKIYADFSATNKIQILVPADAPSVELIPVTTGKVRICRNIFCSYESIILETPKQTEEKEYILTVSEDGLEDSEYIISLKKSTVDRFNGMFFSENGETVCFFSADEAFAENTGFFIDINTGEKISFSYMIRDDRIKIKSESSIRKGRIASDEDHIIINWDDGSYDDLRKKSENYKNFFTRKEIAKMASGHFEEEYKRLPVSINIESINFDTVKLIIEDSGPETKEYSVNIFSAFGTEKNGKCIDFSDPVKDTGVHDLSKGTWVGTKEDGTYEYFYFAGNGTDFTYYSAYDFSESKGTYSIDYRTIETENEEASKIGYIVIGKDDTAEWTGSEGEKSKLYKYSDKTLSELEMYSVSDIEKMITDHEINKYCRKVTVETDYEAPDKVRVRVNSKNYSNVYYVDLKNAEASDSDGFSADLKDDSITKDRFLYSGMWKLLIDGNYTGYVSMELDSDEVIMIGHRGNTELFTVRTAGNDLVLSSETNTLFFEFNYENNMLTLSNQDPDADISEIILLFASSDNFYTGGFYTTDGLMTLAVNDYEMRMNVSGCTADYEISGKYLNITVTDPINNVQSKYTNVDPVYGGAENGALNFGNTIFLPQTGIPSVKHSAAKAAALMSMAAGAFLIFRSKRDQSYNSLLPSGVILLIELFSLK